MSLEVCCFFVLVWFCALVVMEEEEAAVSWVNERLSMVLVCGGIGRGPRGGGGLVLILVCKYIAQKTRAHAQQFFPAAIKGWPVRYHVGVFLTAFLADFATAIPR